MSVLPRSIQQLINEFSRLPGIGPKSASRLAFFLLRGADPNQAVDLANALVALKENTRFCSICHNITEDDPCVICTNEERDSTLMCVVEEPLDLVAIERSRAFKGRYHVLHGSISPVEGIGPDDLTIESLVKRIDAGEYSEVIIATNATLEGDTTARYLERRLASFGLKLSSLARGLAVGSDLEYTDEVTLSRALQGRQEL
ncbi:MAG: recombination mediator RecR [Ardenticatenaceae bacterium]|nr:recombination mediator RecR [Ardenticatenaceae bacterium]